MLAPPTIQTCSSRVSLYGLSRLTSVHPLWGLSGAPFVTIFTWSSGKTNLRSYLGTHCRYEVGACHREIPTDQVKTYRA